MSRDLNLVNANIPTVNNPLGQYAY
jgi:hypothetical protein